ncbi:MAG: hypothetical protein J6Y07_04325 [Alphaproteobacteria bacterium]|nr:hypothetical protein [Alphaproteobacteria bacterium]
MKLKSVVQFYMDDYLGRQQITGIDDIKKVIAENLEQNGVIPYKVEIIRKVCIIDLDKSISDVGAPYVWSPYRPVESIDEHPVEVSLFGGRFNFICPCIMYQKDMIKYLMETHLLQSTPNFKPITPDQQNLPICFDIGATYTIWSFLDKNTNVILDKNLNQIWPTKTNKPPVGLVELMNKTTEKVY